MKQCTVLILKSQEELAIISLLKTWAGGGGGGSWGRGGERGGEKKRNGEFGRVWGGGSEVAGIQTGTKRKLSGIFVRFGAEEAFPSVWMDKNGAIFWVCISHVCYCCHRYSRFGFSRRSPSGFVLLAPSIQFAPAMERVSSKFDPLLMKQQLHRVELIIAPQGRRLLYEYCGCLREERQLCCLRSCSVLIFTLNRAGIRTRRLNRRWS